MTGSEVNTLSSMKNPLWYIIHTTRTGSAWLLRGQHRQSLLESISLRRARWVLGGGNVVFQWTPAHRGVYPNHYADVMAKAYLGREVAPPYDDSMQRQGTQVQYGVVLPDGNTGWMAGDRRLLELVKKRLARYALRRAMAEADYAVGDSRSRPLTPTRRRRRQRPHQPTPLLAALWGRR